MFDSEGLAGMGSHALLTALSENHRHHREAECGELLLAAAWADDQDREAREGSPAQNIRASIEGGRRGPAIDEDAVAEFGAILGLGMVSARNLIGDAVNLRWRFPRIWARVQAAGVAAWQARAVVHHTSDLSWDQAVEVDTRLAEHIGLIPWPRFQRLLQAAVLDIDPDGVAAREVRARTERFVHIHDGGDGLKLLVARATSGDITWFWAAINRIADILTEDGDTDPLDIRRSRAIGILAQPARALQLIADHARDDDTTTDHTTHDHASHEEQANSDQTNSEEQASSDQTDENLTGENLDSHRRDEPDQDRFNAGSAGRGLANQSSARRGSASRGPATQHVGGGLGDEKFRDSSKAAVPQEPAPVDLIDDETGEVLPDTDPDRHAERTHQSLKSTIPAGMPLNPRALRPRVTLYFHLTDAALDPHGPGGLVRPEHGSPLSLNQLHDFLTDTGCHITVRPVTTPADTAAVDCYEIPNRIREAVRLRHPVDVFPYGTSELRGLDLDHTIPYQPGGPTGQTGLHNLGPLSRAAHRAATPRIGSGGRVTGRWRKRQPTPGVYLWRSPHGFTYLTTNHGTLALGTNDFAAQVWNDARPLPTSRRTPMSERRPTTRQPRPSNALAPAGV